MVTQKTVIGVLGMLAPNLTSACIWSQHYCSCVLRGVYRAPKSISQFSYISAKLFGIVILWNNRPL